MQVQKFIIKASVFVLINIALIWLSLEILKVFENRHSYQNWETESDGLIIPQNKPYDLLIMGSSHGRIFARDKNLLRVDSILHKNTIDIAKGGGGGGIVSNLVLLKYFYSQGNSAGQIVYFMDAWPFFSRKWNEDNYFLTNEPIRYQIFKDCLHYHIDRDVLLNYFKSKYTADWLEQEPVSREINSEVLKDVSPEAIQKRLASLYIEPYDDHVFNHYAALLEEVVKLAQSHHSIIAFIFPATLLDDNRGKEKVIKLLSDFKAKYGVEYYDYSNAIPDPKLYYDHDHLNTKGVVYFTEKYLRPIVQ